MKKVFSIIGLAFLGGFVAFGVTYAQELKSDSYTIQFGNFNSTSGTKTSASYNLTDTVGQTASGPYGTYGSTTFVGGGFQYIYQIQDFSFIISKQAIDFGTLTPGSFATDTHTLTITSRGGGGYTVYAYEQEPLTHQDGTYEIANTNCDSGCTNSSAGVWSNASNPGFGFNMSGDDIPGDFVDGTYFRPFADDSAAESMQVVMSSAALASNNQSTVTYKAAIGGSQAAGKYATGIIYVAVPAY